MAFPLTEEQREIVLDRGGELLVSAAAGSGKTRVLVERLLHRVMEEGLHIDQFLVITYTKAAAAELRGRIAQELTSRLAECPTNRHLRKQTTFLHRAHITTIHSFCSWLLRESGHRMDLNPDARLCDEGEADILRRQVLEELLEEQYEGVVPGGAFAQMVDTLAPGRDDQPLVQLVLELSYKIQSHPDPMEWLEEQKKLWNVSQIQDVGETCWGRSLLQEGIRQGQECIKALERALQWADGDELLQLNYVPSLTATLQQLNHWIEQAALGWDQGVQGLPISMPMPGRKRKRSRPLTPEEEEEAAQAARRVKELRQQVKDQLDQLASWMDRRSPVLLEEMELSRPVVQQLLDLVGKFYSAYEREKNRRGLLDFSDLEHLTVKMLYQSPDQPSEMAELWSHRFQEVMVDEYQDTNQVQNAIFWAISRKGQTLFQVGDVKQSIYRFRLADPTIFLEKYHQFVPGDQGREGEPRRRVLSQNFRSSPPILEGCNDLFRAIMSQELGELDYTSEQELVAGGDAALDQEGGIELFFLDLGEDGQSEEEGERAKWEAQWAARRIDDLLNQGMQVSRGGALEPIRPSDIMLLLRSHKRVLHHYVAALSLYGIPWRSGGGEDPFSSTEVKVALALLQVVDNPRQDVPLIAVLRSPVYGFDGDKLARLRTRGEGDFYQALCQWAEEGDQDCQKVVQELQELRFGAGDRTCGQMIWHIYESTNLLGLFGGMPRGQERVQNLLTLHSMAQQLEQQGCTSLFSFLLRLERMREAGTGWKLAQEGQEREGVSILSIHRAKGLEAPVVLLCGLSNRLNQRDMRQPVLVHPKLGIGPRGLDGERKVLYDTLARRAVENQLERELRSEELRLLYVGMTRARQKLILSMAFRNGRRLLERLAHWADDPVPTMGLESRSSVGEWILLHALTRPEGEVLRQKTEQEIPLSQRTGTPWTIRWVEKEELLSHPQPTSRKSEEIQSTEYSSQELREAMTWCYPHQQAVKTPSKLTATQIKGRLVDQEVMEDIQSPLHQEKQVYRPDFMVGQRGLTGAQRGTALHLAMQYLPLQGDHSVQGIRKTLDQLTQQGFLTQVQRRAIGPKALAAFFASPLGQQLKQAKEVHKEFKFSLLVDGENYGSALEGEEILLQGVIDCWFQGEDGITLLDFKSDRIQPGQEAERGQHYRTQLQVYSEALERMTGQPVAHRVLWFFATGVSWELPM